MDAVDALTKEPTAMVATLERKALLELCQKVFSKGQWRRLIKEKNEAKIRADKKLVRLVNKHVADYFWVTRDYEDPAIDFKNVVERLNQYQKSDWAGEYKKLVKDLKQSKQARERYLKELKLTKEEKDYFASMRVTAYLKELRKRYVSEALYYFDKVLLEIGQRLFLSIKQVRYMATWDVKAGFLEGEDLTDELNKRNELSLWYSHEGKTDIYTGKVARENFAKFCAVNKNATEFTGMPVSPGIARGPVRIIMNPEECDKVRPGEVIVSVQVVPSFSTAIMRAAALVCDGGHGITTHPATLAREAGIPAVIQTRFAREALKDGDIVEVDGYKGTVKKL